MVPGLLDLAGIMARDGALTFGGGGPTIVALERAMVHRNGWLPQARFRLAYALARLTPGTNLFAFCTALGWQVRGVPGAFVALAAASGPCSGVTVAITILLDRWQNNPAAALGIQAAGALAIGLLTASCWPLLKPHIKKRSWSRTVILLTAAVALQLAGVPPLRTLVAAGIAGALWREPA